MDTSAGISRTPYLCVVQPKVCGCKTPPKELATARHLDRAVAVLSGYWNVYLGFFGDQMYWLEFLIIDRRDGQVLWRNGRHTTEGKAHGKAA